MRLLKLILSTLIFTSCIKDANVKLPEIKAQPVMYCYISPEDTIIQLRLWLSQPLYTSITGKNDDVVKDASVSISSNNISANLLFNDSTGYYEISTQSFPINYGQTYNMHVLLKDGTLAEAQTSIPTHQVPIADLKIDSTNSNSNEDNSILKIYFNDDVSATNYYSVQAIDVKSPYNSSYDTVYYSHYFNLLYSDNNHNGEYTELKQNFNFSNYYNYLDIYLLNCSYDYYQFHYSLKNNNGDDLFSEPSLTYTNIKNGLGVFAGYSKSKVRITL